MLRLMLALTMACMTSGCLSTIALASGAYTTLVEPKTVDGGRWGYVVRDDRVQFQEPKSGGLIPSPGELTDLPGADAATFVVLDKGQTWAKDKARVYHRAEVLEGADPATFSLVSLEYVKDARTVWYMRLTIKATPLVGANPATFRVLSTEGDEKEFFYKYATDGASVWMHDQKLEGVDATKFHMTAPEFGTDGQRSYYQTLLMPGVVGGVTLLNDYHWFIDSVGSVFFFPSRYTQKASDLVSVKVCDVASFQLVGVSPYATRNDHAAKFGADKRCVFFGSQQLPTTDRASWTLLAGDWSRDKDGAYFGAVKIPEIDAASGEIIRSGGSTFLRDRSGRCWDSWAGKPVACPAN